MMAMTRRPDGTVQFDYGEPIDPDDPRLKEHQELIEQNDEMLKKLGILFPPSQVDSVQRRVLVRKLYGKGNEIEYDIEVQREFNDILNELDVDELEKLEREATLLNPPAAPQMPMNRQQRRQAQREAMKQLNTPMPTGRPLPDFLKPEGE